MIGSAKINIDYRLCEKLLAVRSELLKKHNQNVKVEQIVNLILADYFDLFDKDVVDTINLNLDDEFLMKELISDG